MNLWLRRFALISPYLFLTATVFIGAITPGYSFMSQTISRLSLGTFGWLQTINLLVFAGGLLAASHTLSVQAHVQKTQRTLQGVFIVTAVAVVLLAIFPTDPIDTFPKQIWLLSPSAIAHFFVIGAYILLTPFAIGGLSRAFRADNEFRNLSAPTLHSGYAAFVLSIIWFAFFYFGIWTPYRGLFQRVIVVTVFMWIIRIINRLHELRAGRSET